MRRAFAICWLVLAIAHPSEGATIFFDDFNDGSATDGSPVMWAKLSGYNSGTFDATSGDYVLTGRGSGYSLVSYVSQPSDDFADISLRTQVRTNGFADGVGFLARLDVTSVSAYGGGIDSDGNVFIGWVDPEYHALGSTPTPLRVAEEDVLLQFDVVGNALSMYAWRPGDQRPASPTLQVNDERLAAGGIGILNDPGPNLAATFRFVHAEAVPEPSALAIACLLIPGSLILGAVRRARVAATALAVFLAAVTPHGARAVPVGRFVDVHPVTEVNSAAFEWAPLVSNDGLELFFSSDRADPEFAMYRATRTAVNEPFGNAVRLDGISSIEEDDPADISPDGLTLYFASARAGGEGSFDLYTATRPSLDQPFGDVTSLGIGVNGPFDDGSARVSADGLSMVFHSLRPGEGGYDVYSASRASINDPFANVQPVAGLNTTFDEFRPTLSADGLTLFFSDFLNGQRPGGAGFIDLWVASRDNTSEPFGEPVNLNDFSLGSEINTDLGESLAYVSRDWPETGSRMYFVRGAAGGTDIYEATWVPEPSTFILVVLFATGLLSMLGIARRGPIATLLALAVVTAAPSLSADTILLDDFNDGNATDGLPAEWVPATDYRDGTFSAASGDYVLAGDGSGNALVAYVSQPPGNYSDISLRTQVRTNGETDGVALFARLDLNSSVTYQGGIHSNGNVYIGWNNPIYHSLGVASTPLRVASEDILLQFDVFGDSLRLYAWRPGEQKPTAPTVQVSDQRFGTGGIGILNDPQGATAATFDFVYAATHTIEDGDATDDGVIDLDDLNAVRNSFGSGDGSDQTGIPGDTVPFDGRVDLDDLNAVRNNFGAGASTNPVPEPTSLALAVLLATAVLAARRFSKLLRLSTTLCVVLAMIAPCAHAKKVFIDPFDDGNADAPPVQWTPGTVEPGIYDASSGDYVFTPTVDSEAFLVSDVLDFTQGDTSVRAQGRVSTEGGALILTARNQNATDSHHYFGGIGYFADLGGTILFAGRNDVGTSRIFFTDVDPVLPFDVRAEDAVVQLDVIGKQISLTAWRKGDPMPAAPQITATDDTYGEGWVRIASTSANGNVTTFRYVAVADSPIVPEPQSLVLLALASLGLFPCCRRLARRQRESVK